MQPVATGVHYIASQILLWTQITKGVLFASRTFLWNSPCFKSRTLPTAPKQWNTASLMPFDGLSRLCVHFPATVGFQSPFLAGLARNIGARPHLELQDYRNEV